MTKPMTKPMTTSKKASCANDYDNDGLCGDDDKCPFSDDNDVDKDGLCAIKCTKVPKGSSSSLRNIPRMSGRQHVTRASGQKRVEDTRVGNVFKEEYGGDWYICLRTDPCPNDPTNKCKDKPPQKPPKTTQKPGTKPKTKPKTKPMTKPKTAKPTKPEKSTKPMTKPMTTSKKASCANDYDNDGLCGDDDKCPFSDDNDVDKDGLCAIKCTKAPKGSSLRDIPRMSGRQDVTRASGQKRVEDTRVGN